MKSLSRRLHATSQYRERSGDAELLNSWLFPALNGDDFSVLPKSRAKRIAEILRRLQQVEKVRIQLRPFIDDSKVVIPKDEEREELPTDLIGWNWLYPYRHFEEAQMDALNRSAGQVLWETNLLLMRYTWAPVIRMDWDLQFKDTRETEWNSKSEADYHEKLAVWLFTRDIEEGTIDRYRHCDECAKWFYALTDHQRFCSDACRKKYASGSDEYRSKRRKYMRRYRRDQKELNVAAVRTAKKEKGRGHGKR